MRTLRHSARYDGLPDERDFVSIELPPNRRAFASSSRIQALGRRDSHSPVDSSESRAQAGYEAPLASIVRNHPREEKYRFARFKG